MNTLELWGVSEVDRYNLVPSGTGIQCTGCYIVLRVTQFQIVATQVGALVGAFALFITLSKLFDARGLATFLAMLTVGLAATWTWAFAPRFAVLRRLHPNEHVRLPLGSFKPTDEVRKFTDFEPFDDGTEVTAPNTEDDAKLCAKCNEKSPPEFEVCWNCGNGI